MHKILFSCYLKVSKSISTPSMDLRPPLWGRQRYRAVPLPKERYMRTYVYALALICVRLASASQGSGRTRRLLSTPSGRSVSEPKRARTLSATQLRMHKLHINEKEVASPLPRSPSKMFPAERGANDGRWSIAAHGGAGAITDTASIPAR